MKRREFIALIGVTTAWPFAVRAQQPGKVFRLAVIFPNSALADMTETGDDPIWRAFFVELRRLGWVEGRNLVVDRRSAEGRIERYADIANDVVRRQPDVIFASSTALITALRDVTTTIPIVSPVVDPVGNGFAASLARPGGNVTGTSDGGLEIFEKYLQILSEINPKLSKVAFLAPRTTWERAFGRAMREAAGKANLSVIGPPLDSPIEEREYRRVLDAMVREGAEALLVGTTNDNHRFWRLIVEIAEQSKLVTLYTDLEPVKLGGGLIAYAEQWTETFARLARYVDLIFKGAKAADLPFYRTPNYYLAINLKTAKAQGVTIPLSLLVRADEVIE